MQNTEMQFNRIIGTDWYDGLLSGFAECSRCGKSYWFTVIAWDESLLERVYAFMPIDGNQFNHVLQTLNELAGPPNWPVWVPVWNFPDSQRKIIEEAIDSVIADAGQPSFLVSAKDLASCISIRKLKNEEEIMAVTHAVQKNEILPDKDELSKWIAFLNRI